MSALDLTGTGTLPAGGHRMGRQDVRIKSFVLIVLLVLGAWGSIETLGGPRSPGFTAEECRELTGVPVLPDCASSQLPPNGPFSGGTP